MATILLIEDDVRLAKLISKGLRNKGYTVETALNGDEGKERALGEKWDMVISDIILPGTNGIVLCRELRDRKPNIPILMLTALGTTDDKLEGFDAGADDYLVKPFEFRELFARVKVLLKRAGSKLESDEQVLKFGGISMDVSAKTVSRDGVDIDLTPKEFNLLEYMLKNPKRVLSREEIAKEVWDTHFDTGTNFIDVYINYLRKKIDKPFDKKLIHTKSGMGFILRD